MAIALKGWVQTGLCWLLGALFVIAGALKVPDPAAFLQSIDGYRMLPGWTAALAAVYLPWLEIVCGLALGFRKFYSGALALLIGLTGVFIVALSSAWLRGLDIDCGCFGSGDPAGRLGVALARDVVLLAALGWLWRRETKKRARDEPGA